MSPLPVSDIRARTIFPALDSNVFHSAVLFSIQGLAEKGYQDGLDYFFIPEWNKLNNVDIWSDASTQIFFTLGIACASLINNYSYKKFHNNCQK